MSNKTTQLEALKNHATTYEVAIWKGDVRYLLAYTGRKGRQSVYRIAAGKGAQVVALSGIDNITFAKGAGRSDAMSGDWTIGFTGRTRREAICQGELPMIPAVASQN